MLERTPGVQRALLGGHGAHWTDANSGEGTFSPRDVVGHLIDCERENWIPRAEAILERGPWRAHLKILDISTLENFPRRTRRTRRKDFDQKPREDRFMAKRSADFDQSHWEQTTSRLRALRDLRDLRGATSSSSVALRGHRCFKKAYPKTPNVASGRSPKLSTTVAPASRRAETLPSCVPLPPSMIAPAWLKRVPSLAALPPT